MATTPNFGWLTPDDTDNVNQGAAAIRSLGADIDTYLAERETQLLVRPGSNTDLTSATFADWGPAGAVTIPAWATQAIVRCSINSYYVVNDPSNLSSVRPKIGTAVGEQIRLTGGQAAGVRDHAAWSDTINLTATGAVNAVMQGQKISGTGDVRLDNVCAISWSIVWLP